MKALLITAWRNDRGAYLFDSMPRGIEIDEQDLLNLYNLHRLRDTKANFQILVREDLKLASFYSGGYDSPYVGRPNFGIAVWLDDYEKPDDFERPLRILTNNILVHLEDPDFDEYFEDVYNKILNGEINEIKIERKKVDAPAPKKIVTTSTVKDTVVSDSDALLNDLLATVSDDEIPDDLKFDEDAFRSSLKKKSASDPFGGKSSGDDLFGSNSSSDDLFGGDPFSKAATDKQIKKSKTKLKGPSVKASEIIDQLIALDERIPKEPSDDSPEKKLEFLERKVGFLERKISILSQISKNLQEKEQEIAKKDELIAKLIQLLS